MKVLEDKINKFLGTSLITSIIFVVIGIFLFIRPDTTLTVISYTFGGILTVLGIASIIKYFKGDGINLFSFELSFGILILIIGLYLIFEPKMLSSIFTMILGIWIIVSSVTKFQYSLVLKRVKSNDFAYTLLVSVIMFAWGILLLFDPFKSSLAITQTIGVFIIVYAILDIIENFMIRKNVKEITSLVKKDE